MSDGQFILCKNNHRYSVYDGINVTFKAVSSSFMVSLIIAVIFFFFPVFLSLSAPSSNLFTSPFTYRKEFRPLRFYHHLGSQNLTSQNRAMHDMPWPLPRKPWALLASVLLYFQYHWTPSKLFYYSVAGPQYQLNAWVSSSINHTQPNHREIKFFVIFCWNY